jgi:hypothetical protein
MSFALRNIFSSLDQIIGVMLREARKEALPYRRYAVQVMGQVAEAFQSDMFPAIYEMLCAWCISMVGELLLESAISNEASFRTRGGA